MWAASATAGGLRLTWLGRGAAGSTQVGLHPPARGAFMTPASSSPPCLGTP